MLRQLQLTDTSSCMIMIISHDKNSNKKIIFLKFGFIVLYSISTLVGYLMLNPLYISLSIVLFSFSLSFFSLFFIFFFLLVVHFFSFPLIFFFLHFTFIFRPEKIGNIIFKRAKAHLFTHRKWFQVLLLNTNYSI